MDNRVFILPVASLIIAAMAFFYNPQITGQVVSEGRVENIVDAEIRVVINGLVPEDTEIVVTLANQSSAMSISEFIHLSGSPYNYVEGSIPEIGYEGYGYDGPAEYTVAISEFGLDTVLPPGRYILSNAIYYEDTLLSYTEEIVEV